MAIRTRSRKADAKGRVVLFPDFANALVVVERVGENEIRIRKVRAVRRFSLEKLLAGITADNLHGEVDVGPPVGNEMI
jgi:antitoxin component of MazEF toxin-antitoxin module